MFLDGSYPSLNGSCVFRDGSYRLRNDSYVSLDGSYVVRGDSYLSLNASYMLRDDSCSSLFDPCLSFSASCRWGAALSAPGPGALRRGAALIPRGCASPLLIGHSTSIFLY